MVCSHMLYISVCYKTLFTPTITITDRIDNITSILNILFIGKISFSLPENFYLQGKSIFWPKIKLPPAGSKTKIVHGPVFSWEPPQ